MAIAITGGFTQPKWSPRLGLEWKPAETVVKRDTIENDGEEVLPNKLREKMMERDKEFMRALMEMEEEDFFQD